MLCFFSLCITAEHCAVNESFAEVTKFYLEICLFEVGWSRSSFKTQIWNFSSFGHICSGSLAKNSPHTDLCLMANLGVSVHCCMLEVMQTLSYWDYWSNSVRFVKQREHQWGFSGQTTKRATPPLVSSHLLSCVRKKTKKVKINKYGAALQSRKVRSCWKGLWMLIRF